MRLLDKVVVITGAAQGIGFATAQRMLTEGARVVLADRSAVALAEAVTAIRVGVVLPASMTLADRLLTALVDVTERATLDAMVRETDRCWGRIDVLVNNAGITADARLSTMTADQFDRVVAVNLKGVWQCTQAVLASLLAQAGGVILNASSVVALTGNFGQSNYAAAKAGVIAMTKTWARELGPKGIRCNAVCPGLIDTPMLATIPPAVLEKLLERIPLHRLGRADEVAGVYAFLASNDASYLNGAVIEVSGGIHL